ncbi:MAG: hypothetical protein MZV63_17575 [Marinilabiliales bacterium]|nr:hypothetical protein [Marinilabiliales bacterium]
MVLIIPDGFAEAMAGRERPRVQVLADAVNATSAQLGWNYLSSVVRDYNRDVLISTGMAPSAISRHQRIAPVSGIILILTTNTICCPAYR